MKIYIIRHSESQDDLINCYGGAADWDITENGIKQVEAFRSVSKNFGIQKFYSSPYRRAFKTAEIINKDFNAEIETMVDLREFNTYGVMCGTEKNLAKELFKTFLDMPKYQNADYNNNKSFYGGEDPKELDKRIARALKTILKKEKSERIAIVTHGNVFKCVFKTILKHERKVTKVADAGYAELNYNKGKFEIVKTEGIKFE